MYSRQGVFLFIRQTHLKCVLWTCWAWAWEPGTVLGQSLDLWKSQAKHQGGMDVDRLHHEGLEQQFSICGP